VRANCLKGAPAIEKPVIPGGATDSLLPGFGHCLAFCTQGGENSREKSKMSWLSARRELAHENAECRDKIARFKTTSRGTDADIHPTQ
jgi:hypothetical protein